MVKITFFIKRSLSYQIPNPNPKSPNSCCFFYNGTNVANPIDEDDIISDAKQIQLTNMQASTVELRANGKELYWTGGHVFQLEEIANSRSLPIGIATFDNLRCWKDNHLNPIEYFCTGQI